MIAALYVEAAGCYAGLPDVDAYPIDRDARLYAGPHPVVCHPPCERWGRYWHGAPNKPHQYKLGDDGGCFAAALAAVRQWGGILEHPADSHAWKAFDLAKPSRAGGWIKADDVGGWTCCVEQGHYGHIARKRTWLYANGVDLPELRWGAGEQRLHPVALERYGYEKARRIGMMAMIGGKRKTELRNATPIEFRDMLIATAMTARKAPRMRVIDCEQGSADWLAARAGRVTASRIADVVARGKSGPSASRANYAAELVIERITGQPYGDKFRSAAMDRGNEQEAGARELYAFMVDQDVETVGFVLHPTIERAGCSPDSLVGERGLAQFKCPHSSTHLDLLMGGSIEGRYVKQMQWEMACTGRQWTDFVSFDDRFPPELQLHIQRIERDDAMIAELETAARVFLAEVEATVAELRRKFKLAA